MLNFNKNRRGQAMAELVVALVVILILVTGVSTIATLCLRRQSLRQTVRAEAGKDALGRSTQGWVDTTPQPETRSNPFHRLNAHTHLEEYAPAPISRLPSSNYTLSARNLPKDELGLKKATREEVITLDAAFSELIYPKGSIRLREEAAFPATDGLWR